jgi:hypothetical protein
VLPARGEQRQFYFTMLAALHSEFHGKSTLPVCLGNRNSNRLVSLWNMLQVHANRFVTLLDHIGQLESRFADHTAFNDPTTTRFVLHAVRHDCDLLGLVSASKQNERIWDMFAALSSESFGVSWSQLTAMISQLRIRIQEDLEEAVFFQVKADKLRLYCVRSRSEGLTEFTVKAPAEFFGSDVLSHFPSTAFDVGEACECFLVDRSTACVYHLMCVLQIGLTALAHRFNIPSDHTNWHNMIELIEKEIRNMPNAQNRLPEWKNDMEFYSQAAVHFMFVKDAWRNHVAHARVKYGDEDATKILENVRGFMRTLAERLQEQVSEEKLPA